MRPRFALALAGLLLLWSGSAGCGHTPDAGDPAPASPEVVDGAAGSRPSEPVIPAPRAGADLIGTEVPSGLERGRDSSGNRARATLYRWWTDKCPYCVASLPAIEELRVTFEDRGLETIAVFHPKPPIESGELPPATLRAMAAARGYHGRVSSDLDWSQLQELWLETGTRRATSASFLCDEDGVVRFVHPGPELHPSTDPNHELCNKDYRALEQAIEALLDP